MNLAANLTARRPLQSLAFRTVVLGVLTYFAAAELAGQERPAVQTTPLRVEAIEVEAVEIGFSGHYKVAEWTPLRLKVRSPSALEAQIVVEAPDSDDNFCLQPGPFLEIAPNTGEQIETSFRTGRLQGELLIRLVDRDGRELWKERLKPSNEVDAPLRPALRHDVPLWLTFADLPELRDPLPGTSGEVSAKQAEAVYDPRVLRLRSLRDLPRQVETMEAVDVVVLSTGKDASGKSLLDEISTEASDRLRAWAQQGGTLIITLGADEGSWRSSPLAQWVPVSVEGTVTYRQLTSLESFSGVATSLRLPGLLKGLRLGALPQRNVLVRDGGGVLIASVPYGFGRVTVAGLDLVSPPFSSWAGLPPVLRKMAGVSPRAARQEQGRQANQQLTHTGITDLATQLQTAVEDFPDVPRPSHWWVMGLIAAYLVVIGPIDYYFCHRVLRRPELTWLTLPILVGAGAFAAMWGAEKVNARGLQVNQLDLVDIDSTTQALRGRSMVSIYSPENRRFEVSVVPGDELTSRRESSEGDRRALLSWSGVPENSVSGVYRNGGASVGGRDYRFRDEGQVADDLPVLQWSIKSLAADWTDVARSDLVESRLEAGGPGQISGSITHHLPGTLENCLLVVGGWAFAPTGENGAIPANIPWQPGGSRGRARDLKALLTGERRTKQEKDQYRTEVLTTTAVYDPLNHNPVDLIQMISFHQAVGETAYTGLRNAPLRYLDMTRLTDLGRGILVGRLSKAQMTTKIDGTVAEPARHDTFVRLVVPVKQIDRAATLSIPKPGEQNSPTLSPGSEPSQ